MASDANMHDEDSICRCRECRRAEEMASLRSQLAAAERLLKDCRGCFLADGVTSLASEITDFLNNLKGQSK